MTGKQIISKWKDIIPNGSKTWFEGTSTFSVLKSFVGAKGHYNDRHTQAHKQITSAQNNNDYLNFNGSERPDSFSTWTYVP